MATLASQGAAYGFTLTIWATGALAAVHYGPFDVPKALLHISGPLLMYALLVGVLYGPGEPTVPMAEFKFAAFGFLDFLSVPAAIGTAFLVYELIPLEVIGLPVGTFLATLVYNLLLTVQLAILVPEGIKEEQDKVLARPEEEIPDHM